MNNKKAKIGFITAIVGLAVFLLYPDQKTVLVGIILSCVLGIVGCVFGFMAKSELKKSNDTKTGYATAAIVFGIILAVLSLLGIAGTIMLNDEELINSQICPLVTDCKEKDENNYTCNYYGTEITCKKEVIDKKTE